VRRLRGLLEHANKKKATKRRALRISIDQMMEALERSISNTGAK